MLGGYVRFAVVGFGDDSAYYEPNDLDPPATTTDVRREGKYQNERRYLVNAVVWTNEIEYIAGSEVAPFNAPPSSPWSVYTP